MTQQRSSRSIKCTRSTSYAAHEGSSSDSYLCKPDSQTLVG
uniref:Uncharacterized protein n=1 Tax=Anguilla anguilla TaxID=7936 RepID=A0A0E9P9R0_ANGAN